MPLLSDKLAAFRRGAPSPQSQDIERNDAAVHGIALSSTPAQLVVEKQVRIHSQFHGGGDRFIGAYSYMNDGGYMRGRVYLGRFCSIGRRVSLGAGMHSITGLTTSPLLRGSAARGYQPGEKAQVHDNRRGLDVIVHSDVWIGDGAVLLPGIEVGVGAVIAANAVVTSDVRPYSIVGGVPAREISRRFDDGLAERLRASAWWELPIETLEQMPVANVFQFLEQLEARGPVETTYDSFAVR